MRKRVYVETTIPSFYFEARSEPSMVARREWTRAWWHAAEDKHELVTSEAVIEELSRGDFPARNDCIRLIADLPLIPVEPAVVEIVRTYMARSVMPRDPAGDALHPGYGIPSSLRFSGDMELQPPCERQQVRPHQARERHAGYIRPGSCDTSGTTGRT